MAGQRSKSLHATSTAPRGGITGWGAAIPPTVVTNDDIAQRLDTSDEWIRERTGIRERRIGGTTEGLATEAAQQALERAGVGPHEIDLLVVATATPGATAPHAASEVHARLGLQCPAFDLNTGCAGFVMALVTAHGYLGLGYERVLVVGAETLSRITDPDNRATAVLLADGGGAVVVERSVEPRLLGWDMGTDSGLRHLLMCDLGGYLRMKGSDVFREAVHAASISIERVLKEAAIEPADVSVFVPHQANLRMIEAIADNVGLSMDTAAIVLDRLGNTSSASIPLALAQAADEGRMHPGDIVLLAGFGSGLSWATAALRW